MNGIVIAIIVVAVIGLACAVMLSVASKLMAVPVDERFEPVRNCLPGANCGACGYAGCDDYANALIADETVKPNLCVPGGKTAADQIAGILGVESGEVIPMIARVRCRGNCDNSGDKYIWDSDKTCKGSILLFSGKGDCPFSCIGFGDCAAVCPQKAICMQDGISHINQELCIGCGLCAKACPAHVIEMIPRASKYVVNCNSELRGKEAMNVCKAGCIGCSKCVKSCPFEAITMEFNLAKIDQDKCKGCGKCAEDCPRKCILPVHATPKQEA